MLTKASLIKLDIIMVGVYFRPSPPTLVGDVIIYKKFKIRMHEQLILFTISNLFLDK